MHNDGALRPAEHLGIDDWEMKMAPHALDVKWSSLTSARSLWLLRFLVVNAALVIFLLFFTVSSCRAAAGDCCGA